jgi:CheY-like chemotaxis protein
VGEAETRLPTGQRAESQAHQVRCSGSPHVVEEVVLALDHFPGLTANRGDVPDIVELARRYGVSLARARDRVSIVPASKDVASHLAIAVGTKVAKLDRIVAAVGGDPVEWRVAFTKISSGKPRMRVLVVEDNFHAARALKASLERLEMLVVGPAATTAEARRLIAENNPRLALVDMNLKHETAADLIDELHAQGTPVIIVSGYALPAVAKEKVVAFLQKPLCENELIMAMRSAVRERN